MTEDWKEAFLAVAMRSEAELLGDATLPSLEFHRICGVLKLHFVTKVRQSNDRFRRKRKYLTILVDDIPKILTFILNLS